MAAELAVKRRPGRTLLALLAAPSITALFATVLMYSLLSLQRREGYDLAIPHPTIIWVLLSFILMIPTLLLLWPFHAIAVQRCWTRATTYIAGGAAIGLVAGIFAAAFQRLPAGENVSYVIGYSMAPVLLTLLAGVLTSWLFWLIRRPKQDLQNLAPVFE